jgi:hypothetical protein
MSYRRLLFDVSIRCHIWEAQKTSKSARKRNIPIGIPSTSTTALYPSTTQLLQCMSGAIWVLHQNRKRGWSYAAA